MQLALAVVSFGLALTPQGAAVEEETPPLCAADFIDPGSAPVSVSQAQFEDEVDLSGEAAVIDVLVLYTKETARRFEGDLSSTVDWMVHQASAIMLNSGANARLRLVGLVGAPDLFDSLEKTADYALQGGIRGLLSDEAGRLRDRYGADLMYVLMSRGEACGAAFIPRGLAGLAGYTYAGAIRGTKTCMRPDLLAHEVGHNLGLVHDRERQEAESRARGGAPIQEPMRPGGRGFYVPVDESTGRDLGTIMTVTGGDIHLYSTSRFRYNGRVVGLPGEHEAASALRWAAPYAAALKESKHDDGFDYPCVESSDTDCMGDGRFSVRVSYRHPDAVVSERALTREAHLGDTASLFHFFDADNPELLVKVVDGCAVNGHYWVFGSAATDLEYEVEVADASDGSTVRYVRDASDPLISDTSAFRCEPASGGASGASRPLLDQRVDPGDRAPGVASSTGYAGTVEAANAASLCYDYYDWACLRDGRFHVQVDYKLPEGSDPPVTATNVDCGGYPLEGYPRGSAYVPGGCATELYAPIGDNAALFFFFSVDNPELLVKVLDGCAVNGHYWVFGSAATDLQYRVDVRDRRRPLRTPHERQVYVRDASNPLIADTEAFPCEL